MTQEKSRIGRIGANQLLPVLTALIAIVFIYLGLTRYGFWDKDQGPMPGFFPVVISIAMFLTSILTFVFSFKEKAPVWSAANWLVVLSVALIIGATFLIGLIPSVGVYVLVWLRGYEKCSWKQTLITFAVIMSIVILCFVVWLGVPFPKGLIFQLIFG